MTRKCLTCGLFLPDEDFPFRNKAKNQRKAHCRTCFSAKQEDYYCRNPGKKREKRIKTKEWQRKHRQSMLEKSAIRKARKRAVYAAYKDDYFTKNPGCTLEYEQRLTKVYGLYLERFVQEVGFTEELKFKDDSALESALKQVRTEA